MNITLETLFESKPELLNTLHKFINIPIVELRNNLIKSFFNHEQVKPILEQHNLLPDYVYHIVLLNL